MKRFANLLEQIERAADAPGRVSALGDYFAEVPPADAAWAVFLLSGGRLRRALSLAQLRLWVGEACRLPTWLVEESVQAVGDHAEAFALLLPQHLPPPGPDEGARFQAQQEMSLGPASPLLCLAETPPGELLTLARLIEERLLPFAEAPPPAQKAVLWNIWNQLNGPERWRWHQLLAGAVRASTSRKELVEALSLKAGLPAAVIEHRLRSMEQSLGWTPTAELYLGLLAPFERGQDAPLPDPFCEASILELEPAALGEPEAWLCEWHWGGLRAQLIRHDEGSVLWTKDGEDITAACPTIMAASADLPPGTALEGAVLTWAQDRPLPTAMPPAILKRGRQKPAEQPLLSVIFMASDLLRCGGVDWRNEPLVRRRQQLERVLEPFLSRPARPRNPDPDPLGPPGDLFMTRPPKQAEPALPVPAIRLSPQLSLEIWSEVEGHRRSARAHGTAGIVLKPAESPYLSGGWLIWPAAPFVVDAILVGIQPAPGGASSSRPVYTLAVWEGPNLVPIALAACELDPAEADEVEAFAKEHTESRFGPVRAVAPKLVLELAFAGMASAPRRRSGFQLDQPRAIRLRRDRTPEQAATVAHLRTLLSS